MSPYPGNANGPERMDQLGNPYRASTLGRIYHDVTHALAAERHPDTPEAELTMTSQARRVLLAGHVLTTSNLSDYIVGQHRSVTTPKNRTSFLSKIALEMCVLGFRVEIGTETPSNFRSGRTLRLVTLKHEPAPADLERWKIRDRFRLNTGYGPGSVGFRDVASLVRAGKGNKNGNGARAARRAAERAEREGVPVPVAAAANGNGHKNHARSIAAAVQIAPTFGDLLRVTLLHVTPDGALDVGVRDELTGAAWTLRLSHFAHEVAEADA